MALLFFPLPVVTRWEEKPVGVLPPSQRPLLPAPSSYPGYVQLEYRVQICDNGQHLDDDFGCADPRIDIVGADQKRHIVTLKVFQKPHEVGSFTADSV